MLNPIFSRSHRIPWAKDIPRTPTNTERVQAYRAIAPVEFWNARFQPNRQDEAAAARGALADGDYSPDPPTPEEVAEAYQFSHGETA